MKEGGGFADGGGRGGSDDGGCGVEDARRPGGRGKDMMNGCPEAKIDAILDVPNRCQQAVITEVPGVVICTLPECRSTGLNGRCGYVACRLK